MGIAIFEVIGPGGEQLAERAAGELGLAVGFDPEFDSVTFDGDDEDADVEAAVIAALDGLHPGWSDQLRGAD
jgi:hypothetical protein